MDKLKQEMQNKETRRATTLFAMQANIAMKLNGMPDYDGAPCQMAFKALYAIANNMSDEVLLYAISKCGDDMHCYFFNIDGTRI